MVDYFEDTRKKTKSKNQKSRVQNSRTSNVRKAAVRSMNVKTVRNTKSTVNRSKSVPVRTSTIVRTTVKTTPKPRKRKTSAITYVDRREYDRRKKLQQADFKRFIQVLTPIIIIMGLLLMLGYRNAIINTKLSEKEKLKSELSAINKQNAQLQVAIESSMNINQIEQLAKEKLGMQKLSNDQKVYVVLHKQDYTESSKKQVIISNKSWWEKLIDTLKGE